MKKIVVIGSLNMDLVANVHTMPKVGETVIGSGFKQLPGGKGANQAVAIARLGGKATMLGKVGDDGFGQRMREALKNDGVDVGHVEEIKSCPTGVALITVDEKAQNAIVVVPGANFHMTREDIDSHEELLREAAMVVLQMEIPLEVVQYALKKAKALGKYTILNPAPARHLNDEIIRYVDLLVPNETELEIVSGMDVEAEKDILRACKVLMDRA